MKRMLGPLEARRMKREAGNALARKDKSAPAAERQPFEDDVARATRAVRAYYIVLMTVVAASGYFLATRHGEGDMLAPDSSDTICTQRDKLPQLVDIEALAHPNGDGNFDFRFGDVEVRLSLSATLYPALTLQPYIDFPHASGVGTVSYKNMDLPNNFDDLRRLLRTAECGVRVTGEHGGSKLPTSMGLVFDPTVFPADFPTQFCDKKAPPATQGAQINKNITAPIAQDMAKNELETEILGRNPLVVQVDFDGLSEGSIVFSLQYHEELFQHRYVDSVDAFQAVDMDGSEERRKLKMGFFQRGKGIIYPITAKLIYPEWIHDIFRIRRAEAVIAFHIQNVKDELRTSTVQLEFTPRALAWYEQWKQEHPDSAEAVKLDERLKAQ